MPRPTGQDLESDHLEGPRTLWRGGRGPLCLFLDGEIHLERMGGRAVAASLGIGGAWLSCGDALARHHDFTCSPRFERFVLEDLLSALGAEVAVLAGLSLSGLAAAHLALRHPDRFPVAICQSPSAWWDDEWLAAEVRACGGGPVPIWISVGRDETATGVQHPPTGLLQRVGQRDACRRLAEAWGPSARFVEFDGGHDPACWREELPEALAWALTALRPGPPGAPSSGAR